MDYSLLNTANGYPDSEEKNGSQKYDVFFHFYVLLHLGCGLTSIPHIESRVRHFRTKYGAIEVMLANSGFSWDENRKMVQCEKQQYEDHCKRYPDAKR
uniref:Myb/SANT-like domain-containing protein n=1 Tax=Zea mays TaxID=4577 RepID=A0A804NSH8_MAIZE